MESGDVKLLRDGIARNASAVLSLPSAGMLRHARSRFLAEFEGGVLVEAVAEQEALAKSLVTTGEKAIITFKCGANHIVFGSRVRKIMPQWKVNETTLVDALLLEFPMQIKSVQRRTTYRAKVTATQGMSVRVWRIAEKASLKEVPQRAQEVSCELRDLSVGGMGVRFYSDNGAVKISAADRLRIEFKSGDNTLLLEGRMRLPKGEPVNGAIVTGVSFRDLEGHLAGRQAIAFLTRLVGELQREELRKYRMGLAKVA